MQVKTLGTIISHPLGWLYWKRQTVSADKDVEKNWNPHTLLVEKPQNTTPLEHTVAVPQKATEITI